MKVHVYVEVVHNVKVLINTTNRFIHYSFMYNIFHCLHFPGVLFQK